MAHIPSSGRGPHAGTLSSHGQIHWCLWCLVSSRYPPPPPVPVEPCQHKAENVHFTLLSTRKGNCSDLPPWDQHSTTSCDPFWTQYFQSLILSPLVDVWVGTCFRQVVSYCRSVDKHSKSEGKFVFVRTKYHVRCWVSNSTVFRVDHVPRVDLYGNQATNNFCRCFWLERV